MYFNTGFKTTINLLAEETNKIHQNLERKVIDKFLNKTHQTFSGEIGVIVEIFKIKIISNGIFIRGCVLPTVKYRVNITCRVFNVSPNMIVDVDIVTISKSMAKCQKGNELEVIICNPVKNSSDKFEYIDKNNMMICKRTGKPLIPGDKVSVLIDMTFMAETHILATGILEDIILQSKDIINL